MNIFKDIIEFAKKHSAEKHKQCYKKYGKGNGVCHGIYGGDRYTEYLSYGCIGCEYWECYVPVSKRKEKS